MSEDGLPPDQTSMFLTSQARRGPDGRIYIMDFNNHKLKVIDDDGLMETVAGNGVHGFAFPGANAPDSPLENPIDFDFLPDGRVVFLSYHDPRVLVVKEDGKLGNLAGTGEIGEAGDEGDGGLALAAEFDQLDGIAIAPDGAIYVSDSLTNRIRVIRGSTVSHVAGTSEAAYSGDGGPASEAALSWPTALSFGPDGSLYVADSFNDVVRRIDPDGIIETVVGNGERGFSGDGGAATDASLDQPTGIAISDDGTLYVTDRNNFRIRRVSPDGIIDTIAGDGVKDHTGDRGLALEASFGYLARVTLDGDSLLVADQSNNCVRRIYLPQPDTAN